MRDHLLILPYSFRFHPDTFNTGLMSGYIMDFPKTPTGYTTPLTPRGIGRRDKFCGYRMVCPYVVEGDNQVLETDKIIPSDSGSINGYHREPGHVIRPDIE